jgi:hypothetical protein
MSTVDHPFGSRIIAKLPKLHSQVIGKSFGHRYAEGIYLCSDDKTPAVHMYDMMSRKIMIVSDFIVYPDQFPFHSLNCLVHPSYTAAEIAKMHTQDIADDAAVSADQQTQALNKRVSMRLSVLHPYLSLLIRRKFPSNGFLRITEYAGRFATSGFKTR